MGLNYRHWFFLSILALVNIVVFGCIFLVLLGKMFI